MAILFLHPGRSPLFPDEVHPEPDGLVALGGALTPEVLLQAYRRGIFPWTGAHPIPWYSPDPRLVLFPPDVHVSRSMRKLMRHGELTVREDTCFLEVMRRCALQSRPGQQGTWITTNMLATYGQLHAIGHAHSVEVYQAGALVGGLYGVSIGRAFFGESMFAAVPNASKTALIHLCRRLAERGFDLIDCQQVTGHLMRMGAVALPRRLFLERLRPAVAAEDAWGRVSPGDSGR
jgi:leucyl/phenylalanyl-tRNA--protein transferase